jgi:hypothetical protein
MNHLEKPTKELIENYIEKFTQDKRYLLADKAIINLFSAFPNNKKLEDILLKISVINDLYSTNIFGTYRMAKHIQSLNIDHKLKEGNPDLVNEIAKGHGIRTKKKNTELNFYSFATKYCNWHNQESYAIYDSFVEKVLIYFKRKDNFSTFRHADLKEFKKYKKVINDFLAFYDLSKYNLKEIDKFLWIYGKEKFPTNYNKQKL